MYLKSLEHPSYSPDLPLYAFQLFDNMKEAMGGKHFEYDEGVESFVCNWRFILRQRDEKLWFDGIICFK